MRTFKPLIPLGIMFLAFSFNSAAQCDSKIEYSHKKRPDSGHALYLHSALPLNAVKVQLYDLYQGKVVEERVISALSSAETEAFKNIKPSVYTIYISINGCNKPITLGGINGIKIGVR